MANIPNKPSYSHGSTGTAPASALDYANGDPLDADNLDYYVNTPLAKIKGLIDALETVDNDVSTKLDSSAYTPEADTHSPPTTTQNTGGTTGKIQIGTGLSSVTIQEIVVTDTVYITINNSNGGDDDFSYTITTNANTYSDNNVFIDQLTEKTETVSLNGPEYLESVDVDASGTDPGEITVEVNAIVNPTHGHQI